MEFPKLTPRFIRNPLGIIGSFISLIYGFACFTLDKSISNLENENERLPLIWFVIIYPILILILFFILVVKHHTKLYAPSDFKDESIFSSLATISPENIEIKANRDAELLEKNASSNDSAINSNNSTELPEEASTVKNLTINSPPQNNTIDKKQNLINKVKESERLAINYLTIENKKFYKSNIRIALSNGHTLNIDGLYEDEKSAHIVEIKYWEHDRSINHLIFSLREFLANSVHMLNNFANQKKQLKIYIIIVWDNINLVDETTKSKIAGFIDSQNNQIRLRQLDYQTLLERYD
ncbi:MAG: hypothetical protein IM638_03100 [Bacteroidetes bacterium]|nr:hypothetical protein [Bacteroidota bacterium]